MTVTALAPKYLDDEGGGLRCYLRHDQAYSRGEAEKRVENMGFPWEFRAADCDVVAMLPTTDEDRWLEVSDEIAGAVRFWRWRWFATETETP